LRAHRVGLTCARCSGRFAAEVDDMTVVIVGADSRLRLSEISHPSQVHRMPEDFARFMARAVA
jgi:hypothetical protein